MVAEAVAGMLGSAYSRAPAITRAGPLQNLNRTLNKIRFFVFRSFFVDIYRLFGLQTKLAHVRKGRRACAGPHRL